MLIPDYCIAVLCKAGNLTKGGLDLAPLKDRERFSQDRNALTVSGEDFVSTD